MNNVDTNLAERPGDDFRRHAKRNQVFGGVFLVIVGAVFMLKESGVYFPSWFFSWPMILIAVGIFSGLRHGFRNFSWVIMILIGAAFLADEALTGTTVKHLLWPAVIMMFGLLMIIRPKNHRACRHDFRDWKKKDFTPTESFVNQDESYNADPNDYIDSTAVFGGVKKNILSKNFKGGDITNVMGGTELNLLQADMTQPIIIDTTNVLGGTKLIVPASWDIKSELVAVFGGVEDKRHMVGVQPDPNKVLILKGTCFLGGIEIKSYA